MNIFTAMSNGTSGTLWMDIPTFIFGNGMYIAAYMCMIATFIWSLPRAEDRENDPDEERSETSSEDIVIPQQLRNMLTKKEAEYISDRYSEIVAKTVEDAKRLNIPEESTPEQVMMKMKPLLVSLFREMKGLDQNTDGEIEVEEIQPQSSFVSKPTEGIKYEKLEAVEPSKEFSSTPEADIMEKYNHLLGKSYVKCMEEVAKDGYKLHILYVGQSAQKVYPTPCGDKIISVWIDDRDYDYYRNIPSEMAEIKAMYGPK